MEVELLNGREKEVVDGKPKVQRYRDKKNIVIMFLLFIVVSLLIVMIVLLKASTKDCHPRVSEKQDILSFPMCKNDKITINPDMEDRSNIFRELTLSEMKNIDKYIDENFNLNRSSFYSPIHNTVSIQNIELYLPNKEGALNFLDKSGKQPERQARVTIVHYPFNVTYYIIGPVSNPTYHKLLKFNDRENPLPEFATGMYRLNRASKLEKFSKQTFIDMWPLMKDTYEDFEGYATPEDLFKAGLKSDIYANQMNKENELSMRISWFFPKNYSHYVHTSKFSYILVFGNISSTNESEWDIFGVTYGLEYFKDIKALMALYRNNKLALTKIKKTPQSEKEQAGFSKRGNQQNYFDSQEPMQISPNGPRFSIEGRKVTYLDWKFNFLVQSSSGPALFNVKFKDQRIAYELSLQEASSFYSTGSPALGSMNILDGTWAMGRASSLIHGIDCPHHSVYQDVVVFSEGTARLVKDAICIFEINPSVPLRRHHHSTGNDGYTYGGMNDASLVMRFITDMYNYDYIHDFVFHQNGAIEIKTILTGVLYMNPYYPENRNKYGYEVISNVLGGFHDHFMLFKLDLDILGTKNSFKTIDVVTKKFADPWEAYPVTKKYLEENKRTTELNATIKYNFDQPKYYVLYNEKEHNKYGNTRGYRILPVHKIKEVYPDDHIGTRATEWSKYQLSISKYKETERYGSCMFNYFPQYRTPLCSFDKMIKDDENIVNEDLVAWVPVGAVHIPCSEDFPLTPTIGNQATLFIKPFNYFDEDPSMASANNVYITKTKNKTVIKTNNTPKEATCSIPKRNIY